MDMKEGEECRKGCDDMRLECYNAPSCYSQVSIPRQLSNWFARQNTLWASVSINLFRKSPPRPRPRSSKSRFWFRTRAFKAPLRRVGSLVHFALERILTKVFSGSLFLHSPKKTKDAEVLTKGSIQPCLLRLTTTCFWMTFSRNFQHHRSVPKSIEMAVLGVFVQKHAQIQCFKFSFSCPQPVRIIYRLPHV